MTLFFYFSILPYTYYFLAYFLGESADSADRAIRDTRYLAPIPKQVSRKTRGTPSGGRAVSDCCLLFPSRSHVVPCFIINPSTVIRSRLCKGCYGIGRSNKFKPLVFKKISTPPYISPTCQSGSIFLKNLVFPNPYTFRA